MNTPSKTSTSATPMEVENADEDRNIDQDDNYMDFEITGDNEECATVTFKNEDHTLGNAVRYLLMRQKEVSFASYTVPHPLDHKMVLRIQTNGQRAALDCLKDALITLDRCAVDIGRKLAQ